MNIEYDQKVDAIYITLAKGKYDRTRKVTESILVDEDKKGKAIGVEILKASKNLSGFDIKNPKVKFQTV